MNQMRNSSSSPASHSRNHAQKLEYLRTNLNHVRTPGSAGNCYRELYIGIGSLNNMLTDCSSEEAKEIQLLLDEHYDMLAE